MPTVNVMVDLETLDTRETSVILAIGAVKMDLEKLVLSDEFYVNVDGSDCQRYGLTIGADTVAWWMQQKEEARAALAVGKKHLLVSALSQFQQFLRNDTAEKVDVVVWGNGATFDNMIMRNAYRAVGMTYPASYRNDMCFRTMRRMFPDYKATNDDTLKHTALNDARWQANTLLEILKGIRHDVARTE